MDGSVCKAPAANRLSHECSPRCYLSGWQCVGQIGRPEGTEEAGEEFGSIVEDGWRPTRKCAVVRRGLKVPIAVESLRAGTGRRLHHTRYLTYPGR